MSKSEKEIFIEILFSQHALDVMKKREISKKWVFDTLQSPFLKVPISNIETHYYKQIDEAGFRCLKVVLNPKERRVITTYFDRNMRKKGCK